MSLLKESIHCLGLYQSCLNAFLFIDRERELLIKYPDDPSFKNLAKDKEKKSGGMGNVEAREENGQTEHVGGTTKVCIILYIQHRG